MTRILLIAPKLEKLVHDIPVHDNDSVRKIESFIKNKIPIPLRWGGAECPHKNND